MLIYHNHLHNTKKYRMRLSNHLYTQIACKKAAAHDFMCSGFTCAFRVVLRYGVTVTLTTVESVSPPGSFTVR